MQHQLVVKRLGRQDYEPVWKAMHEFTDQRTEETPDEVWLVEHNPVFTQGQAGKALSWSWSTRGLLLDQPTSQKIRRTRSRYNHREPRDQHIKSIQYRLCIRKGCSFHGLALNVNMDLTPFLRINPCGYAGMEMVQVSQFNGPSDVETVEKQLIEELVTLLDYERVEFSTEAPSQGNKA